MKKWKIFLIQHSHVDIGYTERQERIERYQVEFIRQAVDNALDNRDNLEGYKEPFKFTCESFWAVEKYIETYGDEGERRFLQGIRDGKLELTGFYLHNAELLSKENWIKSIQRATTFAKKHQLKITSALSCDVNGFPWSMPDMLADEGISYLMTCINTHHGGAPFQKPLIPFYWEGPEGNRVLVWNGLTYHKANLLGLIPGPNPMGDAGIPGMKCEDDLTQVVKDISQAEVRIKAMIEGFESIGYEYNFLPIMGSGLYTDNSPVTIEYLRLIDEWNEKHGNHIEIVTSTVEEFFKYLKENVEDIPTYRGDWNDWWTDGVISTPMEVKAFRHAQKMKDIIVNLNKDNCISKEEIDDIEEKLFLFSEHTWGHSASEEAPWDFFVNQVGFRKSMHAYNADQMASKALDKLVKQWGDGEFRVNRVHEYSVVNPTKKPKKDVVLLPVDFWEVSMLGDELEIVDEDGKLYDYQIVQTLRGTNVCIVCEVDAISKREFRIRYGKDLQRQAIQSREFSKHKMEKNIYNNGVYEIKWNENGLDSLVCLDTKKELLMKDEALGKPVYQLYKNGQRRDAAGFGYSSRTKPLDTIFKGRLNKVEIIENGSVFARVKLEYEVEGTKDYFVYATFYQQLSIIDICIQVTKTIEKDPEGLYVQFPFTLKEGKWQVEKLGVFMNPGLDQLPGTCCDYYNVTHGVRMLSDDYGIVMSILDAPMVMFNDLNLWNFSTEVNPRGMLYSWLTNNKWETNFKIQCGGMYDFKYRIQFGKDLVDDDKAYDAIHDNSYDLLVLRH